MQGVYRDVLRDRRGRMVMDSGWRRNTIVDVAWPLIAGLLKNDPGLRGILFWAVGAGRAAWDTARTSAARGTVRLTQEVDRMPVAPEEIRYIGSDGSPATDPAPCIELGVAFSWREARVLREFGLFGGAATPSPGSGILINYVIHPSVAVPAGQSLTRRLRLTLRPNAAADWHSVPDHWLGGEAAECIDGVGEALAGILGEAGISTIRDLARMEPVDMGGDLSLVRMVELRAKARMALRTAADLNPLAGLNAMTPWDVLTASAEALIDAAGGAAEAALRIREQAGALQMTLDNRYLQQVTIGRLAQEG
jgi:hypothetical protein